MTCTPDVHPSLINAPFPPCVSNRPNPVTGVSGMVVALFALSAAQGGLVPPGTEDAAMAAAAAAGDGGVSIAAWASALALLLYVGSYQVRQSAKYWQVLAA